MLQLSQERFVDREHQVARGVASIHGARRRGVADEQRGRRAAQTDGDRHARGVEPVGLQCVGALRFNGGHLSRAESPDETVGDTQVGVRLDWADQRPAVVHLLETDCEVRAGDFERVDLITGEIENGLITEVERRPVEGAVQIAGNQEHPVRPSDSRIQITPGRGLHSDEQPRVDAGRRRDRDLDPWLQQPKHRQVRGLLQVGDHSLHLECGKAGGHRDYLGDVNGPGERLDQLPPTVGLLEHGAVAALCRHREPGDVVRLEVEHRL